MCYIFHLSSSIYTEVKTSNYLLKIDMKNSWQKYVRVSYSMIFKIYGVKEVPRLICYFLTFPAAGLGPVIQSTLILNIILRLT